MAVRALGRQEVVFGQVDRCMFCDRILGADTGAHGYTFVEHLKRHRACHLAYDIWRGNIVDEWPGD